MEDARLRFYFPEKYGEGGLYNRFWITAAVVISMYAAWTLYKIKRPFLSLMESIQLKGIYDSPYTAADGTMKSYLHEQEEDGSLIKEILQYNEDNELELLEAEDYSEKEDEDEEQFATEEIEEEDLDEEDRGFEEALANRTESEEEETENEIYFEEDVDEETADKEDVDEETADKEDVDEETAEDEEVDDDYNYEDLDETDEVNDFVKYNDDGQKADDGEIEGEEVSSGSSDMCSEGCVTVYHLSEPDYETDNEIGPYSKYTKRLRKHKLNDNDNNQQCNVLLQDSDGCKKAEDDQKTESDDSVN